MSQLDKPLKPEDLGKLSPENFTELERRVKSSLLKTMSVISLNENSNESQGIELHDDDSVYYIPSHAEVDEKEEGEGVGGNEEEKEEEEATILNLVDSSSDSEDVTIIPSGSKRKSSGEVPLVAKRPKITGTPETTGNSTTKGVTCSTPVLQSKPMQVVDLEDISPICRPRNTRTCSNCACAKKMTDAAELMNNVATNINKLLSSDGIIGTLNKLINLGDVFEQFQRNLSSNPALTRCLQSTVQAEPINDLETVRVDPEANQITVYNNADTFVTENIHYIRRVPTFGLKPIVIDGPNIAMAHGCDRRFSVRGLEICIEFFTRRGHKVFAFVPAHRLRHDGCDDHRSLQNLVRRGLVYVTSSWEAGGRRFCAYDDRIMLQAAAAMGAVVVSRDHFRDLKKEDPRFEGVLRRGLLMPTFVGDMLIFPQDPLGRRGPSLEKFLSF